MVKKKLLAPQSIKLNGVGLPTRTVPSPIFKLTNPKLFVVTLCVSTYSRDPTAPVGVTFFNSNFILRREKFENYYLAYFNNDIQYGAKFIIKRLFDIFVSLVAVILLSPVWFSILIYITAVDNWPPIVIQNRVGLHGKVFRMYKFRTMYREAHALRDDLSGKNKKTGPLFKLDDDPIIIKGGKTIRRYSLDELPQLINVIRGNMSLVGPRPLFDTDRQYFKGGYMRRLNVMPGMTGLLQINDRNTDDFDVWFKYDLEYIEKWSLYLDLIILIKTVPSLVISNSVILKLNISSEFKVLLIDKLDIKARNNIKKILFLIYS